MVSGACSNQLKVNAIAAAAFWSLRGLLDFLWIWFSLPRFQVVLSSSSKSLLSLRYRIKRLKFFLVLLAFL
jgi:hypothetical protein